MDYIGLKKRYVPGEDVNFRYEIHGNDEDEDGYLVLYDHDFNNTSEHVAYRFADKHHGQACFQC